MTHTRIINQVLFQAEKPQSKFALRFFMSYFISFIKQRHCLIEQKQYIGHNL